MLYLEAAILVPAALVVGMFATAVSVVFHAWQFVRPAARASADRDLHSVDDGRNPEAPAAAADSRFPGTDDAAGRPGSFDLSGMASRPCCDFQHPGPEGRGHSAVLPDPSTEIGSNMSWLSVLKNNFVNAVTHAAPAPEQQAVHSTLSNLADALGQTLIAFEQIAELALNTFVKTHFGDMAAAAEYEFLQALKNVIDRRQLAIQQPTPVPIAPPASAPVAPVQ